MKCFNHSVTDAVAHCKSCGRALCHECIVEVGLSCCCRNRCEREVAILNDLVERGRNAYQKTGAVQSRSGIFMLVIGTVFFIPGLLMLLNGESAFGGFFFLSGLVYIGWGFSQLQMGKKFRQKGD